MPYAQGIKAAGYPRFGTVMNLITAPANYAKTFSLQAPHGFATSDGYPNGTLTSGIGSQGSPPDGYYDKHVLSFDGQARLHSNSASAIVYSKTAGLTIPLTNNCVGSNFDITSTNVTGNRVTFKHGCLISSVSGGNGSPVVLTLVNNTPGDAFVGLKAKVGVGVSASLANGPNGDGSWTIGALGTNTITLANSSGVTSPTVTGVGGPDIQSEIVWSNPGADWNFISGATYTNFANLVLCKIANEQLILNGGVVDPAYTAQLKTLGVRWLRTMDVTGVQGNWESNWSARRPKSFITWAAAIRNPNYDVGTITNNGVVSGAEDFTCSAPSLTNTGPYQHGEIIIGSCNATNATNFATLNVNGRGKKKIISSGASPYTFPVTAAASTSGQTLQFNWTVGGTALSAITYTTQKQATVSGAANNGSGKVRLTVNDTTGYNSLTRYIIAGIVGTTEANTGGGQTTAITVIDATHIDLPGVNFVNAYVSGGTVVPQRGDDTASASNLQNNLADYLIASVGPSGGTGKIFFGNSGVIFASALTPHAGTLSVTYTGPALCHIEQIPLLDGNGNPYLGTGTSTFVYNYIMDGWLHRPGGLIQSVPFEYYTELANAIGADVYHNWNVMATTNLVTGVTSFFRDNLNPGLRQFFEMGNELWNFGQEPWRYCYNLGMALGCFDSQNAASYTYNAIRHRQFGDLARSIWTTTRSKNDLYRGVMSAEFDISNTDTYFLQCIRAGNATALAYGGIDGTDGSGNPASDYSAVGSRVCDKFDAFGFAPYWSSTFLNGDASINTPYGTLTGTVVQNAPLFVAANKYRDGNFTGGSGAYDDLYNQFYASTNLGGPCGELNLLRSYKLSVFPQAEAVVRKYDPARIADQGRPIALIHYEGGPQFGLGNINNGTNSPTVDIQAVSNHLASNIVGGWDISTYTTFGTVAISTATYNSSNGQISITTASPVTVPVAVPLYGLTGSGNLTALTGSWTPVGTISGSTSFVLQGPPGAGTVTISAGTLYLNAMDLATQLCGLVYNFKFSQQFYQLYYNYMRDVTTVHSGREACGAQYGYYGPGNQWCIFPNSWTLGFSSAYSSAQAISDFNAGL